MRKAEVLVHVRRGAEFLVVHSVPEGGGYWHAIAGGVDGAKVVNSPLDLSGIRLRNAKMAPCGS